MELRLSFKSENHSDFVVVKMCSEFEYILIIIPDDMLLSQPEPD